MPAAHADWKVLPHDPPQLLAEGILTVTGVIPMAIGNMPRRMTVVSLRDGSSVIFSAMALSDPAMEQVEAMGRPTWLIVPDAAHRLDAPAYKRRYPRLRIIAPAGSRKKVAAVIGVDSTTPDFADPDVSYAPVRGTGDFDSALIVRRAEGTTLILNDILAHVRNPPGIGARIMAHLIGFGVRAPRIPRSIKLIVKDRRGLALQFRDWAALPDLRRIVVSHGEVITEAPAAVLTRIARSL